VARAKTRGIIVTTGVAGSFADPTFGSDDDADDLVNMGVELSFQEVVGVWAARAATRAETRRYRRLLQATDGGAPDAPARPVKSAVLDGRAAEVAIVASSSAGGDGGRGSPHDSDGSDAIASAHEGDRPVRRSSVLGRAAAAVTAAASTHERAPAPSARDKALIAATKQQQLSRLVLQHAARCVTAVRRVRALPRGGVCDPYRCRG